MPVIQRLAEAIHQRSLWQILGVYLAGGWAVLQVIDQLVQQLLLPAWLYRGTLFVLVAGLPIVLATALLQQRRRRRSVDGDVGSAALAAPPGIFSWRNVILTLTVAFAALGVGAGGFIVSRAAGIGPAATLLGRGVVSERQAVVLADFENLTADSLLGDDITELLRTDLMQSPALDVADPAEVAEVLRLMERDPSAPLDFEQAREVAIRAGIEAVIAGEVRSLGGGYAITARLVAAEDGETLLPLSETTDDSTRLIRTVERLSRRLRERVGESLGSIRAAEPLERVTTASLPALRRYTQGVSAIDRDGDWVRAAELLDEAIALDSGFAAAHRKLGAAGRVSQARRVEALAKAYHNRDRLVERERLQVEGTYHATVTGDRDAAVRAYRNLLESWPNDRVALNNLALLLARQGDRAGAVELLRRATEVAPSVAAYQNLTVYLFDLGRMEESRAAGEEAVARFPDNVIPKVWQVGGFTALAEYAKADTMMSAIIEANPGNVNATVGGTRFLVWIDAIRGRGAEAAVHYESVADLWARLGLWSLFYQDGVRMIEHGLWTRRDSARALREAEALLERYPVSERDPLDRPYLRLARLYARAGASDRAAAWVRRYEAEMPPELRGDERWSLRYVRALLAASRGQTAEAIERLHETAGDPPSVCLRCPEAELALVFDGAGQADSAIAYYESYLNEPWAQRIFEDPFRRAHTMERLGQLYDERGDLENAALYYAQFVELWERADPELQPRVEAARQRLEEILAERG